MDERAKRVEQIGTKVLDAEEYPGPNSVLQGRREIQSHGPCGWRERKDSRLRNRPMARISLHWDSNAVMHACYQRTMISGLSSRIWWSRLGHLSDN